MPRLVRGKLRSELLEEIVLPYVGIDDPQVIIKPRVGFDAGVVEVGDKCFVMSTDPVVGVPPEFFGFFLVHYSASDVALFGARPRWFLPTIMLPEGFSTGKLREMMRQIDGECRKLGVATVKGHTGVYPAIEEPVGASTVIGVASRSRLVTPGGAEVRDAIVATKGIGMETATALAFRYGRELSRKLGRDVVDSAKRLVYEETCVRDALISCEVGVNAMHDATEGGLIVCLSEIALNSNVGCKIYESRLPMPPATERILEHFQVEPAICSSTGTLVATMTAERAQEYLKKLKQEEIHASIIGEIVEKHEGNTFHRRDGKVEAFPKKVSDPYSRLLY